MSIMTVDLIIERIKIAEEASPIAVFRCDVDGRYNAVFAATIETQRVIKAGEQMLVGIYHKKMDIKKIESFLNDLIQVEMVHSSDYEQGAA